MVLLFIVLSGAELHSGLTPLFTASIKMLGFSLPRRTDALVLVSSTCLKGG